MAAGEPRGFGLGIRRGGQSRDRDPAFVAQLARDGGVGAERDVDALGRRLFRSHLQDRVAIEREAGRRLAAAIAGTIAAAARDLAAHAAREKSEADAGVVFEAAI